MLGFTNSLNTLYTKHINPSGIFMIYMYCSTNKNGNASWRQQFNLSCTFPMTALSCFTKQKLEYAIPQFDELTVLLKTKRKWYFSFKLSQNNAESINHTNYSYSFGHPTHSLHKAGVSSYVSAVLCEKDGTVEQGYWILSSSRQAYVFRDQLFWSLNKKSE